MKSTKILITGGAGFIGSALASKLSENPNNTIVIVDNLLTGDVKRIPDRKNIKFIRADVNLLEEISSIFYAFSFNYVFHYAAVVGVKRTLKNPIMVLDDINGIKNILALSKNTAVKRVFFSSSSEVYGEPVELPQNAHTTPLNSRLPYAIVKNVGEAFLRSYKQEYNLDFTIFRFFNTYGPMQSKDFVISKFIACALKNKDIDIYGDGNQSRTFCYIDDHIEACVNAFNNDECVNDVVNIGSDAEISIRELAESIIALSNSNSKIVHVDALEEGDMRRRLPEVQMMKKLLNRESINLTNGLQKLIDNHTFFVSD